LKEGDKEKEKKRERTDRGGERKRDKVRERTDREKEGERKLRE
jgi:hypothetical protein